MYQLMAESVGPSKRKSCVARTCLLQRSANHESAQGTTDITCKAH